MDKVLIDTIEVTFEINCQNIRDMFDSYHEYSCCEDHYLDFDSFETDFREVERNLSKIDKIEIYGEKEKEMGITVFFYDGEQRIGIFIP